MKRIGIVGASGYTGGELLRLSATHPYLEVVLATGETSAGQLFASVHPHLAASHPDATFDRYDPDVVAKLDLDAVVLALPHGEAAAIVPALSAHVPHVIDLSADFRLRDASLYPQWYGADHPCPERLATAAFGIPELFGDALPGAALVAVAGCYVTAAALALAPLVRAGAIETTGVVVDAASGVSGAGRALKVATQFGTVNESFSAYGLLDHRHTPEIEQATGAQVIFTPHLAPMSRGILATCYARPTATMTTVEVLELLRSAYRGPFVHVVDDPPSTKATLGSNVCLLTARADPRTGWVVVIAALDNLVKGASGQALQCTNLVLGLDEGAGLPGPGLWP
ncbi:MAG TPA: N-acetyl-gamma-glutamyl-phosphate reductase [Acidimicrobiales bacterium]|nr:N-acetyl-gamma-glutamyl-phosphate reductase [Acidimicrobiales bacterium]